MVQHDLHHRELVQVGIEQRRDDHQATGSGAKRTVDAIRRSYRVGIAGTLAARSPHRYDGGDSGSHQ